MYSHCLKKLDRPNDFVRISLKALSTLVRVSDGKVYSASEGGQPFDELFYDRQETLQAIVEASSRDSQLVKVALQDFFTRLHIDPHVRHFPDKDGFSLDVQFHSKLAADLEGSHLLVVLAPPSDSQSREIFLESDKAVQLKSGAQSITVHAKV